MNIVYYILILLIGTSLLWFLLGLVPGVALTIMYFITKDKVEKSKLLKGAKVCFGGVVLLMLSVIIYFIYLMIIKLLGVPELPKLPYY